MAEEGEAEEGSVRAGNGKMKAEIGRHKAELDRLKEQVSAASRAELAELAEFTVRCRFEGLSFQMD